jgi:hypothetical protein
VFFSNWLGRRAQTIAIFSNLLGNRARTINIQWLTLQKGLDWHYSVTGKVEKLRLALFNNWCDRGAQITITVFIDWLDIRVQTSIIE